MHREEYLAHHGVLGMKWGVRRYQNKDGSLTSAGEKRYGVGDARSAKASAHKAYAKVFEINEKYYSHSKSRSGKTLASMNKAAKNRQLKLAEQAQKKANAEKASLIDMENKKHIEKMSKYQEKLINKTNKKKLSNKKYADDYAYKVADMDAKGLDSSTFKLVKNERLHKIAQDPNKGLADLFIEDLNQKQVFNQTYKEYSNSKDFYTKQARKWSKANKRLREMKVSEFTTKKDIKNAYRNRG